VFPSLTFILKGLLVPPEEISSSYFYQSCEAFLITPNASLRCILSRLVLMDVLRITPAFASTYQCGSTLLTSYLPVNMYSISLQILSIMVTLIFIFSSNLVRYPHWVMDLFPGIYWPSYRLNEKKDIRGVSVPYRLLRPSQIISTTMNQIIVLLSFGLCSPVLCCYITLSLCANLCCWLMLIGRFVSFPRAVPAVILPSPTPTGYHSATLVLTPSLTTLFPAEKAACDSSNLQPPHVLEDYALAMSYLNQQLHRVNSHLLVCKWPVIITSTCFVTLLCWEMAGDRGGWSQALWAPIMGVVLFAMVWIWDRMLVNGTINFDQQMSWIFESDPISRSPSVELIAVHSSLHPTPVQAERSTLANQRTPSANQSLTKTGPH
jgi:hypothetical protein